MEFSSIEEMIEYLKNNKRFLEKEMARRIDLGFEDSLKPIVREKIKGKIIYV